MSLPHRVRRPLTKRQLEVLTCIAKGYSARECAAQMEIATATVRVHAEALRLRLGARTMAQAVGIAIAYGYLDTRDLVNGNRIGEHFR